MDNFWLDKIVTEYLNSNYAPQRGESKEVNERCMDNFKKAKSINMEDIKLTIGNTEYKMNKLLSFLSDNKTPRISFNGVIYEGEAIPNEQVKRDYEILMCKGVTGHFHKYNPKICLGKDTTVLPCEIFKVKRLYDDAVFCVDDNTDKGKIYAFEIAGKEMIAKFDCNYPGSSRGGFCNINFLSKPVERPILFTTEDGKNIYKDDNAFYVEENNNFMIVAHYGITYKKNHRYFSTKEAAELFRL